MLKRLFSKLIDFHGLKGLGQEQIVEEVGRGQVSKVVLSMGGENVSRCSLSAAPL